MAEMSRHCFGWAVAASFAGLVVLSAPGRAQSALSEQLGRNISQAQKSELQRQFGRALVDRGRTLDLDPATSVEDARRVLVRRASLFETVSEHAKAEADLTAALALEPVDPALYAERGYFYMRRNRFADALADFLTGAKLDPANARFRFAAGRAQAARGNYSTAIPFYDEAIRLNPRDAASFLARAEARVRVDMLAQARTDYDRAIAIGLARNNDRYFAYLGRGYVDLVRGDYSGAIGDFDRALELDPAAVSALLWRGYAREMGGRTDLALDDYERAAAADPRDRSARANLQRLRSN